MRRMDLGSNEPVRESHTEKPNSRELLSRLARYLNESPYLSGDLMVFKGGLFLGEHTGTPRFTQDVDMSIVSMPAYLHIREVLKEFGERLIVEDVIRSYEVLEDVVEGRSGGAKYRDIDGRVLLSIDVSLGGDTLDTLVMDTGVAGRVHLETIEQVLADKLTVLYSRKRFRRAKDLYDIWQIISSCSIDTDRLAALLRARDILPLPLDKAPFNEEHYLQLEHAYDRLQILDPNTELPVGKPSFEEIVAVVGKFTIPFMEAEI